MPLIALITPFLIAFQILIDIAFILCHRRVMKFFNVLRIFLVRPINVRIMASTPIFKAVHNLIAVFLIEFHNADKKAFKTAKLLRVKAIQPRTIANTNCF